jgi:hypothetical protein
MTQSLSASPTTVSTHNVEYLRLVVEYLELKQYDSKPIGITNYSETSHIFHVKTGVEYLRLVSGIWKIKLQKQSR